MKKKFLVIAIFAATILACKHTVETPDPGTGTGTGGGAGTGGSGGGTGGGGTSSNLVCFESDILPIFTSNCAKSGCHNAATHTEGYILDSYNGIRYSTSKGIKPGNPDDSEIYEAITETDVRKRMPYNLPPLSPAETALIRKWILEGALNTTNCGSACDPNLFTYSGAVKPIIDTYCKGCHSDPATATKPQLTTYAGIKAVAQPNGRLLGAINHAPGFQAMPQAGPKSSDCKITQITKWVNAGAPNN
jgi:hypothetical protein